MFSLEDIILDIQGRTHVVKHVPKSNSSTFIQIKYSKCFKYGGENKHKGPVQETNLGLDMNATHLVLAYADTVSLIGDDIKTIQRNAYLFSRELN